ncbi:MAG: GTPase [Acidimicrobiales bacterium]
MTGPLCTRVAQACDQVAGILSDGSGQDLVRRVREGLDEPLRVAVAGRVNAGKSTLVNALLRQRVAPTDVSECTRYVTWYRYGVPERLEVVSRDGSRQRMALLADGSLPRSPTEPGQDVDHLDVYLAHDALRDLVLIDTPGLGSLNAEYSAATIEVLGLDGDSRQAVAQADALVFVLTATLRSDEAIVLKSFRDALEGTSASSLSALCVLNKADLVSDGDDPLEAATALADQFSESLRDVVAVVRPVVSLLAESVETGRFTEAHAVALRALASLPEATQRSLLLSVDRFATADVPVAASDRAELLNILGLYGVEVALRLVTQGRQTAAQLHDDLRARSGVESLRGLLLGTFARNADALKASGALAALERLSYAMADPALADARRDLHDEIDAVRIDPSMHRLQELRALQECATGQVTLPGELEGDLRRLASGVSPAERLGLPTSASGDELQRAASAAASSWKRFRNDGRASPGQQWVADVMTRSCERLWVEAGEGAAR